MHYVVCSRKYTVHIILYFIYKHILYLIFSAVRMIQIVRYRILVLVVFVIFISLPLNHRKERGIRDGSEQIKVPGHVFTGDFV